MNKINLACAILFVLILPAAAQCFENTFFGIDTYASYNNSLIPAQNGYLIAGDDDSTAGCIIKIDALGNCVWTKTYQDYGITDGVMVSDGYMLCTYFFPTAQPALMKVDFNGNCVWTRATADENTYPASIIAADAGGFVFAGYGFGASSENSLYVEKTDASGNCVWAKSYYADLVAEKIINSGDGGYVVSGGDSGNYGFLIKIDSGGDEQFAISTYSGTNYYYAWFFDVVYTGDGYLVTGQSSPDDTFDENDLIVMKTDMDGNTLTENKYKWGTTLSHIGQSVCPTEDGSDYGYLIAGTVSPDNTTASDDYIDTFVMQVDSMGNCKNVNTHHDSSIYEYSLVQPRVANAGKGKYILSARTYSTYWDSYFYDTNGNFKPVEALPVKGGENAKSSYACPQPAVDTIKFVYALDSAADVTINIYNFANRLVGTNKSSETTNNNVTTQVDIKKLPAGIYFYQIIAKHTGGKTTRFTPGRFMVKK